MFAKECILKAYENVKQDIDRWYLSAISTSFAENKRNDAIECIFCIGKAVELSLILEHDFGEDTKEERENLKKIKDYLQFEFLSEDHEDIWCKEIWTDEDLINALEYRCIEPTEENVSKLREACKGMFDDKSTRNEMIDDKVCELFDMD